MKKKIEIALAAVITMALCTVLPPFSFAKPVTWVDNFVQYQSPSTEQCQAWHGFLNQLEPDIEFISVTMSGTFAPEGISITDPAAAQELAYLLYSRTPGSVSSDGHTWSVFIGCNLSSCVLRGEGVELRIDQDPGCRCAYSNQYTVRPDIGLSNWGGVNTRTCNADDQSMMVEFQKNEIAPMIMVGEYDTGVCNIEFSNGYSVNDQIDECAAQATNHGSFVSCVSDTLNLLKKEGLISGKEKAIIQKCAAKADIP